MLTLDANLELQTGWTKQPGGPGTGIDPAAPSLYGYAQTPGYISHYCSHPPQANCYSGWLSALKRPVLTNTGKLRLSWDVMIDAATVIYAQALENDINLTPVANGPTFMAGTQVIYAAGPQQGHLQLWNGSAWLDTGIVVGLLTPWEWNSLAIDISFEGDAFSFVSYTKNGEEYALPMGFQNIPGQMLRWAPCAQVYIQQDLSPAGGSISTAAKNINFEWD